MTEITRTTRTEAEIADVQSSGSAAGQHRTQVRYLTSTDVAILTELAIEVAAMKGADYYGWRNAPTYEDGRFTHTTGWGADAQTRDVTPQEALEIYKQKLDGAYSERALMTIAAIAGLVEQGHRVALLQVAKEPALPFDGNGWIVVSINGYPMFHLSPSDLPLREVDSRGLISVIVEGSADAEFHAWKGTNKVQEIAKILTWATNRALD